MGKFQDTKDLERLVMAKLTDSIIHIGNNIVIEFLNKKVKLSVKAVKAANQDDLAEELAQMQLSEDQFYLIDARTSLLIVNTEDVEPKTTDRRAKPSLDQIGGLDDISRDLKRTMDLALGIITPSSFMKISRAVLISGISGCGKTILCQALAESYPSAHKITIDSWKIFSKFYGESEANLKKHFDEALQMYPTPTVIIIDEISNICPKNDGSDAVKRVSSLLASLIDSLHLKRNGSKVFVLANTSNLDNVDPAIRRSGRLDYEVEIPVPNTEMREKILKKLLANHPLTTSDITEIAKNTHGYVGADLENLISKSTSVVESDGIFVPIMSLVSILENLSSVKPSAMRELLIEKPNVKWSDIGGMKDLKLKLKQIVEWPINHPETFERLGIKPPRGLLMFGPPGEYYLSVVRFKTLKFHHFFRMFQNDDRKGPRY